ncbi:3-hydroxyacyl-CoA dehydrogenase NAD-binding domain-containing protein, partial [Streptomyces albogriseolus]|uniref:3-hydroxyacyl-CoA dehydrogenase NAD-binding domain-containing protein n=1 Tax=Streptomyces albogriseolus TaxID=1887 RepID=UPI003675D4BF
MTALDLSSPVAVVGTGTMGQGIAQVALVAGHDRGRPADAPRSGQPPPAPAGARTGGEV